MKRKSILLTAFLFLIAMTMEAQRGIPEVTEVHEPVPPVVTPGAGTAPPSDAIVLFDGSNLNNWQGRNGDAASGRLKTE
jgi:hypothetical protein